MIEMAERFSDTEGRVEFVSSQSELESDGELVTARTGREKL